ncbi:MAG: ArsR/SmtB family transcription factor [Candidatus Helarchaeota archaeon]
MEELMLRRLRKLLDILGNETRCRILNLVSNQPRFISEISRELDIGQQAILRHLEELESFGLLTSFEEADSEEKRRKGRKRKYYEIDPDAQYQIFINIDKDDLIFDLRTSDAPDYFQKLNQIENKLQNVQNLPLSYGTFEQYQSLIEQLEEEINKLNEARTHALRLLAKLKNKIES